MFKTRLPKMGKTFDPMCLDLAEHFLQDVHGYHERQANDLACTIQQAIESWFEDQREQ